MLKRHYWNPREGEAPCVSARNPVYVFNKQQRAGTWSDLHTHTQWGELAWLVSGSIVMRTEKGSFLGQAKRAVWIPPGLRHEWYLPEPSANRSLFLHLSALNYAPRFHCLHAVEITPLLRELIVAMGDCDLHKNTAQDRRLFQVFLDRLALAGMVNTPLRMPLNHRLVELCTTVLLSPDTPVCLRDWSQQVCMSEKTLARLFKRETGQTIGRWVQGVRLQRAVEYIEAGHNITSVALSCGYTSVSAFIVAFKKHFGTTPGAFGTRHAYADAATVQVTYAG